MRPLDGLHAGGTRYGGKGIIALVHLLFVQVNCWPQHDAPQCWPSGRQGAPTTGASWQAAGSGPRQRVLGGMKTPEHAGDWH